MLDFTKFYQPSETLIRGLLDETILTATTLTVFLMVFVDLVVFGNMLTAEVQRRKQFHKMLFTLRLQNCVCVG